MFCPNCGTQIPDDSIFCEKCGHRIDGIDTETSVQGSGPEQQAWEEEPAQNWGNAPAQNWENSSAPAWEQEPAKPSYIKFIAIGAAALVVVIALAAMLFVRGKKDDGKAEEAAQTSQTSAQAETTGVIFGEEEPAEAENSAGPEDTQQSDNRSDESDTEEKVPAGSEASEAESGTAGPEKGAEPKSPEELSSAEMEELAAQLSTEQYPVTGEFLWAKDFILSGAVTVPEVLDSDKVIRITGDRTPLINGGWKVYISTADGEYGSDMDQYLNAQITAQGENIRVHMVRDRWFFLGTDEIIRDGAVFDFEGSFDAQSGSAQAFSNDARLDLDEFYITKDGLTEYALGTYTWISGEKDRVMMMREIPVLESFEWNIGGGVPSGGTELSKTGEIAGSWKNVLTTMTDVDGVSQTRIMLGITHIRFDGNSASVEIEVRKRFEYPTEDKDSMEALETGEGIVLTFSGEWNESTGEISVRSHNSTLALKISEFTELDGIRYAAGGVYNDTVRIGDFAMYSE